MKGFGPVVVLVVLLGVLMPGLVDGRSQRSKEASVVGLVRVKRNLLQFGNMIDCTTGNPNRWYWDYGCFCGMGGTGNTAVDELDRCCQVHDKCYGDLIAACKGILLWSRTGMVRHTLPVMHQPYSYNCDAATKIVTCGSDNGRCRAWACDCDSKAAMCFARATYQDKFHNYNQDLCK